MYRLLRAKNSGLKGAVTDFAKELVQTPSTSLQESEVATRVERQMKEIGYDKVFRDAAGNVVGILFGQEAEPAVLLCSHMDTVAPGTDTMWLDSPYSGKIENGQLHGRGAADCKAGLAAQVFTGGLLKRSMLPLRGTLVVAATVAEENGLSVGVRALLEKTLPELGFKPVFAILGEPTELGLYYGHDGWLETDIEIKGANPFHVDNAARAIFNELESACLSRRSLASGREEMAVHSPQVQDNNGVRRATVRMDRRLQSAEEIGTVLKDVNRNASLVAQGTGAVAVTAVVRRERQRLYTGQTTVVRRVAHPWQTDPFNPLIERTRQALAAAGCEAVPAKWRLGRLGMGTAGGVMVNEFNLPTVGYGPGSETAAHAPNEYVELDRVTECVYGTAAVVHGLIGIPVFGWTTDEI
jgi:putative selenium metabolism hydrolase